MLPVRPNHNTKKWGANMKRTFGFLLAFCLLLGLLSGCGIKVKVEETPEPQMTETTPELRDVSLKFADSYDEVFGALKSAEEAMGSVMVYNGGIKEEADATEANAGDGAQSDTYFSGTNVQVEGVDEGDIVKTDGTFIYILRDVELIIMKAEGKNVSEVSHTIVGSEWESASGEDNVESTTEKMPVALYVVGDRAVVISSYFRWTESGNGDAAENSNYVAVDIYNIENRSQPVLLKSLGQDGYEVDSRMIGNTLFLCTAYYVYDPDQSHPEKFVPRLYTDGKGEPVPCGTIGILPDSDSTTYAVLGSYDVASASMNNTQSVLGGGESVYMNADNLYLCRTVYGDNVAESGTDGPYTVTTHKTDVSTTVNRFTVADGTLTYAATGSVPGGLNNQFSLDAYNGYLRMATTEQNGGYKVYVDEGHKFENYEPMDTVQSNDVFVLDGDLNVVGSAANIAPDESVYSARFDGDYAYLCTYRTVDPIFAVDLSDPAAPNVVGELSLTGYSDYLHLWTEHQLFGLGMQTQEIASEGGTTARLDGMKMVMIDTTDPASLKEENTLEIDADFSQALYNHKAVLVDQARDLIAFPAEGNYLVYGYSAEQGFQLKKEITFENEWDWQSRGLYIGDCFYVVSSDCIYTIDLNTLENVGQTILSRG